jgi:mitochondrial enoyl-[acyl-carrier protein] reductase / trans-2-enoyl-CoA reductase
MKYVELTAFGTPSEVCRIVDGPALGEPGAGQVLVNIEAGPINPAELLLIEGRYAAKPPLPARLGIEGVGTVAAIGDGVTSVAVGDRVMSLDRQSWAEQVLLPEATIMKIDASIDVAQASMLKVNPATAHLMLENYVTLKAGDWVIQNAANSAVGHYLIQLARAKGVHTVNVVRRDGLEDGLRALGGDIVITDGDDLAQRVRAEIGDAHMPLAIDAVAGSSTMNLAGALSEEGIVVNYGLLSGSPCQMAADQTVFKGITLTGFWLAKILGKMPRAEMDTLYGQLGEKMLQGVIHSPVEATYGLADIAAALEHAGRGGRSGKILVTPGSA